MTIPARLLLALAFLLSSAIAFGATNSVAPNNSALRATPTTQFPSGIWRNTFGNGNYASPLFYTPSPNPCALNAGAGDNGSQVKSSDGKCWIAMPPSRGLSPLQFGAKGDGSVGDLAPFQACVTAAADGGVCLLTTKGIYNFFNLSGASSLILPRGATLDCGLASMTDAAPPMLPSTSYGGALRLDTTHPILFSDTSAKIQNCMIAPAGMVFPQPNSASWTGTAVDTNGQTNPQIVNTTIVGFDSCIDTTTGASGSQRPYLARLYLDCTGVTKASLSTGNNGDIATVQDVKLQVLGTSTACPDRLRAGTGLNIVGSAWVDNVISQDFQAVAIRLFGVAQVFFGKIWIDHATPASGCANATAVGVYMQGVTDIDFSHLDIQGVANGIQLVYQTPFASVHIGDLWLNSISNDGVQMGLPTPSVSGGILQIDMLRSTTGIGGFVVNIVDQSKSSYLTIGGGVLKNIHGAVAPYIATGGESALHFNISDKIVTDLNSPYGLYGGEAVTSCTGNGSGGCGLLNSFRTTPWAGVVRIAAAGATSSSGSVQITWPISFDNASNCTAAYRSETTTSGWPVLYPLTVFDAAPNITQINWGTSGNLPAGKNYDISFECHPQ